MKLVFNNIVTGAFTGRKAECPRCDAKAVGNDVSVLARWRAQCAENAERFLESQFKKELSQFNGKELRLVKQLCTKYMSKERVEALSNLKSFRNRVLLAAKEVHPGQFAPITKAEAERIMKETGGFSDATRRRHGNDHELLLLLPDDFVAQHILKSRINSVKLTPFERILALPQFATPDMIDNALMALMSVDSEVVDLDENGLVILPERTWRRLREARKLDEWPVAMQQRYGREGMLVGMKRGRKPVIRVVVPTAKPITTTPETEQRRAANQAKPVRPVKPVKPAPAPVRKADPLDDWDAPKRPAPARTPEPTQMMSIGETIRFINSKANEALLPGDFPRGAMTPITKWSNTDWLLVHKYRQYIDPKWYNDNIDSIERAMRRFTKVTGETTAAIGTGNDLWDVLAECTRLFDRAGA